MNCAGNALRVFPDGVVPNLIEDLDVGGATPGAAPALRRHRGAPARCASGGYFAGLHPKDPDHVRFMRYVGLE
jgi:hypothetical protein